MIEYSSEVSPISQTISDYIYNRVFGKEKNKTDSKAEMPAEETMFVVDFNNWDFSLKKIDPIWIEHELLNRAVYKN